MATDPAQLPKDVATLQAMLIAAEARLLDRDAEIANLKLTIAKPRRDTFGASSERGARLIDQLELQLADLVEATTEATLTDAITTLIRRRKPRSPPAVRCRRICRASVSCTPDTPPAPTAAASFASSARTSPKAWSWCPRPGKSSSMCARSSRAATASTSRRRRRTRIRSRVMAEPCFAWTPGRPAVAGPGAVRGKRCLAPTYVLSLNSVMLAADGTGSIWP